MPGIPQSGITLICGSTGSGKTLLGIDFLVHGASTYNEPGVFMSFEETENELYKDVDSLNLDLAGLVAINKISIQFVLLERKDIQETDFNLEGLLYMPKQTIYVSGNGDINGNSKLFGMIAKNYDFRGNGIFKLQTLQSGAVVPDIMPTLPTTVTLNTIALR